MNKLDEILAETRRDVASRKGIAPLGMLDIAGQRQGPPRGFARALRAKVAAGRPALIAEIKRASPSKGVIRADFDPAAHAAAYQAGGAACLSVLTDVPFFQGSLEALLDARKAATLPALRKDFMVDPWQVAEARAFGADAILLIVAALDDGALAELEGAALERGMDVLVEVHDRAEFDRAMKLRTRLIGVNARDLRDFSVDLAKIEAIARDCPEEVELVAESGIGGHDDILRLHRAGVRRFLVGETLMRQPDVEAATRALLEGA